MSNSRDQNRNIFILGDYTFPKPPGSRNTQPSDQTQSSEMTTQSGKLVSQSMNQDSYSVYLPEEPFVHNPTKPLSRCSSLELLDGPSWYDEDNGSYHVPQCLSSIAKFFKDMLGQIKVGFISLE